MIVYEINLLDNRITEIELTDVLNGINSEILFEHNPHSYFVETLEDARRITSNYKDKYYAYLNRGYLLWTDGTVIKEGSETKEKSSIEGFVDWGEETA